MTYISWSSDFALYLEDYLLHECHFFGLFVSMTQPVTNISWSSDFALYLEDYLIYERSTLGL